MDDPLRADLVWRRNAPLGQGFTLLDEDGVTPVDLTGYSFKLQLRLYPGAPGDPIVTLTMAADGEPGFYLDDAAAGQFTLTPPTSAALEALPAPADVTSGKTYLAYDILLIGPDSVPEPLMEGQIIILSGVTLA